MDGITYISLFIYLWGFGVLGSPMTWTSSASATAGAAATHSAITKPRNRIDFIRALTRRGQDHLMVNGSWRSIPRFRIEIARRHSATASVLSPRKGNSLAADQNPARPRDDSGRCARTPSSLQPKARGDGSPDPRTQSNSADNGTAGRERSTASIGKFGSGRARRGVELWRRASRRRRRLCAIRDLPQSVDNGVEISIVEAWRAL